ncbi:MAG: hypothetical protein QGH45_08590 [Myxococcota bacterium]|nr:hypothetical protein [Myxococcota bacterium]
MVCWGYGNHGQCSPPAVPFGFVECGHDHCCGQPVDGPGICWGGNTYGECNIPP